MRFDQGEHLLWDSALEESSSKHAGTGSKLDNRRRRRRDLCRYEISKTATGRSNCTHTARTTSPSTQERDRIPDPVFCANFHRVCHFQPPLANLAAHHGLAHNRGDSFATVTQLLVGQAACAEDEV
jgi:hypothetical protein